METRRADARDIIALMSRATGEQPRLWGNIIGFGRYDRGVLTQLIERSVAALRRRYPDS